MLVLSLDSSATASVALANIDEGSSQAEILARVDTNDTRSHAEVMAPFVHKVINQANRNATDIDAVLCGTGPGPFTGLRAGIMTARTLAFAWNKPVLGMMSLTSLAEQAHRHARTAGNQRFLVATDARRREVYTAEFELTESSYQLVSGPTVGSAAEVPALPVYGKGAGIYSEQLNAVSGFSQAQPDAVTLLCAAARYGIQNLSNDTTALYLRESDAKVPAARKKASSSPHAS